jgi:hypothetical protein
MIPGPFMSRSTLLAPAARLSQGCPFAPLFSMLPIPFAPELFSKLTHRGCMKSEYWNIAEGNEDD